jgi:hypothetical protein
MALMHAVAPRAAALLAGSLLSALIIVAPVAAEAAADASLPDLPPELEKVRAALDRYQDVVLAVHDGYFSTLGCVEYGKAAGPGEVPGYKTAGGMGIHFLNGTLISPTLDPLVPQVLLYELDGDKMRLVAAEWFVPLSTGVAERPKLFGQPFDGPMAGHHPLMPTALSHYDLHVWLWKKNPAGLFSPINPDVKCPKTGYSFVEDVPKLLAQP